MVRIDLKHLPYLPYLPFFHACMKERNGQVFGNKRVTVIGLEKRAKVWGVSLVGEPSEPVSNPAGEKW
jgi:hypothetical protein